MPQMLTEWLRCLTEWLDAPDAHRMPQMLLAWASTGLGMMLLAWASTGLGPFAVCQNGSDAPGLFSELLHLVAP